MNHPAAVGVKKHDLFLGRQFQLLDFHARRITKISLMAR